MTEEQIREYMDKFGIPRDKAIFILAIEEGEIDGDVIALDEEGNEVQVESPLMFD